MFPSTFKTIVGSRSGGVGSKKDQLTSILENIVRIFMDKGGLDSTIVESSLRILCLLFKSRDKSKV